MIILMLARRVAEAHQVFLERRIGEPVGMELSGKRLGIIGMGNIGRRLERVAAAGLGMHVIGITSGSSRGELEQLLGSCHVVSIHCPLDERTRGLIGEVELGLMLPGSLLINCARGDVIDKGALLRALEAGRLGGVGLDVHWVEPADPTDPLYQHPKVLALPHMGTITHEVSCCWTGWGCTVWARPGSDEVMKLLDVFIDCRFIRSCWYYHPVLSNLYVVLMCACRRTTASPVSYVITSSGRMMV